MWLSQAVLYLEKKKKKVTYKQLWKQKKQPPIIMIIIAIEDIIGQIMYWVEKFRGEKFR